MRLKARLSGATRFTKSVINAVNIDSACQPIDARNLGALPPARSPAANCQPSTALRDLPSAAATCAQHVEASSSAQLVTAGGPGLPSSLNWLQCGCCRKWRLAQAAANMALASEVRRMLHVDFNTQSGLLATTLRTILRPCLSAANQWHLRGLPAFIPLLPKLLVRPAL
jgi:hypothetical protein